MSHILAIDQGTTSSRAILFRDLQPVGAKQIEIAQHFPRSGWVEHDANEIWASVAATARGVIEQCEVSGEDIDCIGITNQRETVVLWDRATGHPLHRAIVWQDRRTADLCEELSAAGHGPLVAERTGLRLDPYFTATKLRWLLDHIPGARDRAARGELCAGTIDSFLIWHLTAGEVHATDATNASRSLLLDIRRGVWDAELCALFDIPIDILPEVRDSAGDFGRTRADLFGKRIPITGVAGDQQAATVGQGCFEPGMMKATYGTGCFALLNTGEVPVPSVNRLLSTIAYQIDGKRTYALEGSIFVAGAVVQWLRDGLGMIRDAGETAGLAERSDPTQQVVIVPAFTGLGAPYWRPDCRGAVFGLSRNSGPREFARAALESVGFQTRDLVEAMAADMEAGGLRMQGATLRVDGGLSQSDWAMQFLSDILDEPVDRPRIVESTASGAAMLAALGAGLIDNLAEAAGYWQFDRAFRPDMPETLRAAKYAAWTSAVAATMQCAAP